MCTTKRGEPRSPGPGAARDRRSQRARRECVHAITLLLLAPCDGVSIGQFSRLGRQAMCGKGVPAAEKITLGSVCFNEGGD